MKEYLLLIAALSVLFFLAIAVWYSPILVKGYPAGGPGTLHILARNLYKTGIYSVESEKNIISSSELLPQKGAISGVENELTPRLYAQIFKIMGILSPNALSVASIAINAIAMTVFSLAVYRLFDLEKAIVFGLIYIFSPFMWSLSQISGYYEFPLLFFALFFLFLYYGRVSRHKWLLYLMAGSFLGLAFLARNALMLFGPALFIWLLLKDRPSILPLFLPVALLFGGIYLWEVVKTGSIQNVYLAPVLGISSNVQHIDFSGPGGYGHLFPDPYTYHYERDEFLREYSQGLEKGDLESISILKGAVNFRIGGVSVLQRLKAGFYVLTKHLAYPLSLETIGGPLVLLLLLLGAFSLQRCDRDLLRFFGLWIGVVYFLLAFVAVVARQHLMDINFPIILLIALGVMESGKLIRSQLPEGAIVEKLVLAVILIAVLYQFVLSAHVLFDRGYDGSFVPQVYAYAEKIAAANISKNDVIATPIHPSATSTLHYLVDENIVEFSNETVEELLQSKKLDFAFEEFGVTKIIGYSDELSERIQQATGVEVIATSSLKPKRPETSFEMMFLMNLVK